MDAHSALKLPPLHDHKHWSQLQRGDQSWAKLAQMLRLANLGGGESGRKKREEQRITEQRGGDGEES
jgi:hypothetical protein